MRCGPPGDVRTHGSRHGSERARCQSSLLSAFSVRVPPDKSRVVGNGEVIQEPACGRLLPRSRPTFTNVSVAHDTICFECLLITSVHNTRRGTDGRRNRHRSSKRHFLVSHCCLFRGAFRAIPMAVLAGPGIQKLDPVDVDDIPVVFGTRLLVVPGFGTLATLHVNA